MRRGIAIAIMRCVGCLASVGPASMASAQSAVSYVGCDTDVMGGAAHYAAPVGTPRSINATLATALHLNFYQALMSAGKLLPGIYAPRGWHCYAYMGDGLGEVLVGPDALGPQYSGGNLGPGLSLTSISSDSGPGFTFALQVMSAYFPEHLGEYLRSAGALTGNTFTKAQPLPKAWAGDSLQRLGDWSVLITTPAGHAGFGTQSGWFVAGALPVQTLIAVDSVDYWIYELRVRLPPQDAALLPAILQAEPSELRGR